MEKIVHLLWRSDDHDELAHRAQLVERLAPSLLASPAGVTQLDVLTGDTTADVPAPPIQFGRGPELASVVSVWVSCIDDRAPLLEVLSSAIGTTGEVDQYLVTESVPQRGTDRDWPDGTPTPGVTLFSWFPKPARLTDEEFFHGWHEVHTPKTPGLHPLRREYIRDAVARVLTPGSPLVRALVAERWRDVADFVDPTRLFGSDEAVAESMTDLPLYADFDALSSRPMHQLIVRST